MSDATSTGATPVPGNALTRREVIGGLAAATLVAASRPMDAQPAVASPSARPYLDAALAAERWIARQAVPTADGLTWPADPADPKSVQRDLYTGTPGVVLFYSELARVTGEDRYREAARDGGRYLAGLVRAGDAAEAFKGENAGLYTGLAGIAYTLSVAGVASGDARLATAAGEAMQLVVRLAAPAGAGVAWSESNDIISGSSGIGLTLLWAAKALGTPGATEAAAGAGRHLLETSIRKALGLSWSISPSVPRRYPNFSHGAGGVSYFLASLHAVTKEPAFLEGALGGAAYLRSVATSTPGGGKMVFHSEPGNEQLFYLSWCHGPSGTARLFHRLAAITGRREFTEFAGQLDTATRDMKVPEQSPGFWNNISQCCGNCGVVEYLVAQHDRTGDSRALDYARTIADDVLKRATADGDGLKWIQAEHRVRPELLVAQTGLMQGAAGVGLAMLHLDGAMQRRRPLVVLPDNPYYA